MLLFIEVLSLKSSHFILPLYIALLLILLIHLFDAVTERQIYPVPDFAGFRIDYIFN